MTIALLHGWGFDRRYLAPLAERLAARRDVVSRDFGYFGPPAGDIPDRVNAVVAHSLGGLWWLKERPFEADHIILINGFTRFSADPETDFPGVPERLLRRMQAQFRRNPDRVLKDFRARCGAGDWIPEGEADTEKLAAHLDYLADTDARQVFEEMDRPVLALAGDADDIVPPALTRACFERIEWYPGGTHNLPREAPDWCAERVLNLLDPA